MYETILVPTDGSEGSMAAVEHAVDIATRYDASLHALYVVELPGAADGYDHTPVLESLEGAGREAVDEVVERAEAAGVGNVQSTVAQGQAAQSILDYIDDHGVDLVVMGTHGRTGLVRYLVGSVAEKVVRLSAAPVLTVRIGEEEANGGADSE